jgi:periplasmic protein TonB
MKTEESSTKSLDEIVFASRNHEYGAYALRTRYPAYLNRALSASVIILLVSVSIPLIASYYSKVHGRGGEVTVTANMDPLARPPAEEPPPPPPAPPEPLQHSAVFTVPKVVDTATDNYTFSQDELSRTNVNRVIDTLDRTGSNPPPPPVIDPPRKQEPYIWVQEMPGYVGGDAARLKFMRDNLHYPQIARETGISGTVYIEFVVDENGGISQIKLQKGIGGGCDEEAIRVLKLMHWNPGRQEGKAVPVRFAIPIKFTLNN